MRIWNGCGDAHERTDVAHRADIDLGARQERHGAVEVDRVAALDLVEDHALNALIVLERLLELDPAFLAARLVAREDGLAERVLDALDIDLDLVADVDRLIAAGAGELLQGDAALCLGADVDDRDVLLDRDHGSLDDGALLDLGVAEGLLEQRREILAARRVLLQSRTFILLRAPFGAAPAAWCCTPSRLVAALARPWPWGARRPLVQERAGA